MSERRERYAAMRELRELAEWVEQHFQLGHQPKIHTAKESEVIYAQILKRIGGLANNDPWKETLRAGTVQALSHHSVTSSASAAPSTNSQSVNDFRAEAQREAFEAGYMEGFGTNNAETLDAKRDAAFAAYLTRQAGQ